MQLREALAHVALAVAQVSFGGLNVVEKLALNANVNPYVFGLYRDLLACPMLLCLTTCMGGWRPVASARDAVQICLVGLTGVYGNQLLQLLGVQLTSADIGSFYQPLCPILTTVLAVFPWRYERPSWRKAMGVSVGVGGIALLLAPSFQSGASSSSGAKLVAGNVFLAGNSVCGSVYFLLLKPLYGRYSAEMILAAAYAVAALAMVVTCAVFIAPPWGLGGAAELGALAYAALVCSTLGYQLMTWANQHLDASTSACYVMLQPTAACVASYLALGEPVTWLDAAGSALALAGLYAVSSENHSAATRAAAAEGGLQASTEGGWAAPMLARRAEAQSAWKPRAS